MQDAISNFTSLFSKFNKLHEFLLFDKIKNFTPDNVKYNLTDINLLSVKDSNIIKEIKSIQKDIVKAEKALENMSTSTKEGETIVKNDLNLKEQYKKDLSRLYEKRKNLYLQINPFLPLLITENIEENQKILEKKTLAMQSEIAKLNAILGDIDAILQENPDVYIEKIDIAILELKNKITDKSYIGESHKYPEEARLEITQKLEKLQQKRRALEREVKDLYTLSGTEEEKITQEEWSVNLKERKQRCAELLVQLENKRKEAQIKIQTISDELNKSHTPAAIFNDPKLQDKLKDITEEKIIEMAKKQVREFFIKQGHEAALNDGFVNIFAALLIKIAEKKGLLDLKVISLSKTQELEREFEHIFANDIYQKQILNLIKNTNFTQNALNKGQMIQFETEESREEFSKNLGFFALMQDLLMETEADAKNPSTISSSLIDLFNQISSLIIPQSQKENKNKDISVKVLNENKKWEQDIISALNLSMRKMEDTLNTNSLKQKDEEFNFIDLEFDGITSLYLKDILKYFINDTLKSLNKEGSSIMGEHQVIYDLAVFDAKSKLYSLAELFKSLNFEKEFYNLNPNFKCIVQSLLLTSFKHDTNLTVKEALEYIKMYKSIFDVLSKEDPSFIEQEALKQADTISLYLEEKYKEAEDIFTELEAEESRKNYNLPKRVNSQNNSSTQDVNLEKKVKDDSEEPLEGQFSAYKEIVSLVGTTATTVKDYGQRLYKGLRSAISDVYKDPKEWEINLKKISTAGKMEYKSKTDVFLQLLSEDGIVIPSYFSGKELGMFLEAIYHLNNKESIYSINNSVSRLTYAEQQMFKNFRSAFNREPKTREEFLNFYESEVNRARLSAPTQIEGEGGVHNPMYHHVTEEFSNNLGNFAYQHLPESKEEKDGADYDKFNKEPFATYKGQKSENTQQARSNTGTDLNSRNSQDTTLLPIPNILPVPNRINDISKNQTIPNLANKNIDFNSNESVNIKGNRFQDAENNLPQSGNPQEVSNILSWFSATEIAAFTPEDMGLIFVLQDIISYQLLILDRLEKNNDIEEERQTFNGGLIGGANANTMTLKSLMDTRDTYVKTLLQAPEGSFFHVKEEIIKLTDSRFTRKDFLDKVKQFIKTSAKLAIETIGKEKISSPTEFFDKTQSKIDAQSKIIHYRHFHKKQAIRVYREGIKNNYNLSVPEMWNVINTLIDSPTLNDPDFTEKMNYKARLLFIADKIARGDSSISLKAKENFYLFINNLISISEQTLFETYINSGEISTIGNFKMTDVVNPIALQSTPTVTFVKEPNKKTFYRNNKALVFTEIHDAGKFVLEKHYIAENNVILSLFTDINANDETFLYNLQKASNRLATSDYFKTEPEYASGGGTIYVVETANVSVDDREAGYLTDPNLIPKTENQLKDLITKIEEEKIKGSVSLGMEVKKYIRPADLAFTYSSEIKKPLIELLKIAEEEILQSKDADKLSFVNDIANSLTSEDFDIIEQWRKFRNVSIEPKALNYGSHGGGIVRNVITMLDPIPVTASSENRIKVLYLIKSLILELTRRGSLFSLPKNEYDNLSQEDILAGKLKMDNYIGKFPFAKFAKSNSRAVEAFNKFDKLVNAKMDVSKQGYDYKADIYNLGLLHTMATTQLTLEPAIYSALVQNMDRIKETISNVMEAITAITIDLLTSAGTATSFKHFFKMASKELISEGVEFLEEEYVGMHSQIIEEYLNALDKFGINDKISALDILSLAISNGSANLKKQNKVVGDIFDIIGENLVSQLKQYRAVHLIPTTASGGAEAAVGLITSVVLDVMYKDGYNEAQEFALKYAKESALKVGLARKEKLSDQNNKYISIYNSAKDAFEKRANLRGEGERLVLPKEGSSAFEELMKQYMSKRLGTSPKDVELEISNINAKQVDEKLQEIVSQNSNSNINSNGINSNNNQNKRVKAIRPKRNLEEISPNDIKARVSTELLEYLNFLYTINSPDISKLLYAIKNLPQGFIVSGMPESLLPEHAEALKDEMLEKTGKSTYEDTSYYKVTYQCPDGLTETFYYNSADDMLIKKDPLDEKSKKLAGITSDAPKEIGDIFMFDSIIRGRVGLNNNYFKDYAVIKIDVIPDTKISNLDGSSTISKKMTVENIRTGVTFSVNYKENYFKHNERAIGLSIDYEFDMKSAQGYEASKFALAMNASKVKVRVERDQKQIEVVSDVTKRVSTYNGKEYYHYEHKEGFTGNPYQIPVAFQGEEYRYYVHSGIPITLTHGGYDEKEEGSDKDINPQEGKIDEKTEELFTAIKRNLPNSSYLPNIQYYNVISGTNVDFNPQYQNQVIKPILVHVKPILMKGENRKLANIMISKVHEIISDRSAHTVFRTDGSIAIVQTGEKITGELVAFDEAGEFSGLDKGGDIVRLNFNGYKEYLENYKKAEEIKEQFSFMRKILKGKRDSSTPSFEQIQQKILKNLEDLESVLVNPYYTTKYIYAFSKNAKIISKLLNSGDLSSAIEIFDFTGQMQSKEKADMLEAMKNMETNLKTFEAALMNRMTKTLVHEPMHRKQGWSKPEPHMVFQNDGGTAIIGREMLSTIEKLTEWQNALDTYLAQKAGGVCDMAPMFRINQDIITLEHYRNSMEQFFELEPRLRELSYFHSKLELDEQEKSLNIMANQIISFPTAIDVYFFNFRTFFLESELSDKSGMRMNDSDLAMAHNFEFVSNLYKQLKQMVNDVKDFDQKVIIERVLKKYEPLFSLTVDQYISSYPKDIKAKKKNITDSLKAMTARFLSNGDFIDGYEYQVVPNTDPKSTMKHLKSMVNGRGFLAKEYFDDNFAKLQASNTRNPDRTVDLVISQPTSTVTSRAIVANQEYPVTVHALDGIQIPSNYIKAPNKAPQTASFGTQDAILSPDMAPDVSFNSEGSLNALMQSMEEKTKLLETRQHFNELLKRKKSGKTMKTRPKRDLINSVRATKEGRMVLIASIKVNAKDVTVIAASRTKSTPDNYMIEYNKLHEEIKRTAKSLGGTKITNVMEVSRDSEPYKATITFLNEQKQKSMRALYELKDIEFIEIFSYKTFIQLITSEFPLHSGSLWSNLISEDIYYQNPSLTKSLILKALQLSYERREENTETPKFSFYNIGVKAIEGLIKLIDEKGVKETTYSYGQLLDLYPEIGEEMRAKEFIEENKIAELTNSLIKDGLELIENLHISVDKKLEMKNDLLAQSSKWASEMLKTPNPATKVSDLLFYVAGFAEDKVELPSDGFKKDVNTYKMETLYDRSKSVKLKLIRSFQDKYGKDNPELIEQMTDYYIANKNENVIFEFGEHKANIDALNDGQDIKNQVIQGRWLSDIYATYFSNIGVEISLLDDGHFCAEHNPPSIPPTSLSTELKQDIANIIHEAQWAKNGVIKFSENLTTAQKEGMKASIDNIKSKMLESSDAKDAIMQEIFRKRLLHIKNFSSDMKAGGYWFAKELINLLSPFISRVNVVGNNEVDISFHQLPPFLNEGNRKFVNNYFSRQLLPTYLLLSNNVLSGDNVNLGDLRSLKKLPPNTTFESLPKNLQDIKKETESRLNDIKNLIKTNEEFIRKSNSVKLPNPKPFLNRASFILTSLTPFIIDIDIKDGFKISLSNEAGARERNMVTELNQIYGNIKDVKEKREFLAESLKFKPKAVNKNAYDISHIILLAPFIKELRIEANKVKIITDNLPVYLIGIEEYSNDMALPALTLINKNDQESSPLDMQKLTHLTDLIRETKRKEGKQLVIKHIEKPEAYIKSNAKFIKGANPIHNLHPRNLRDLIRYIAPFIKSIENGKINLIPDSGNTPNLVLSKLSQYLTPLTQEGRTNIINSLYHEMINSANKTTEAEKMELCLRLISPYIKDYTKTKTGIKIEYKDTLPESLLPTKEYISRDILAVLETKAKQEVQMQKMLIGGIRDDSARIEEMSNFYNGPILKLLQGYTNLPSPEHSVLNIQGNRGDTNNGTRIEDKSKTQQPPILKDKQTPVSVNNIG